MNMLKQSASFSKNISNTPLSPTNQTADKHAVCTANPNPKQHIFFLRKVITIRTIGLERTESEWFVSFINHMDVCFSALCVLVLRKRVCPCRLGSCWPWLLPCSCSWLVSDSVSKRSVCVCCWVVHRWLPFKCLFCSTRAPRMVVRALRAVYSRFTLCKWFIRVCVATKIPVKCDDSFIAIVRALHQSSGHISMVSFHRH